MHVVKSLLDWGICYSDREGESKEVWDEEIDR